MTYDELGITNEEFNSLHWGGVIHREGYAITQVNSDPAVYQVAGFSATGEHCIAHGNFTYCLHCLSCWVGDDKSWEGATVEKEN